MGAETFKIGDRLYDLIDIYTIVEIDRRDIKLIGDKVYKMPISQFLYMVESGTMCLEN